MGKLNNTILKFMSEHLVECRKRKGNRYRMLIVADNGNNAKQIAIWLKPIYGAISIADDSGNDNDVSLVFDTSPERDEAVRSVNAELVAYGKSHPDAYVVPVNDSPSSGTGGGGGNGGNLTDPDEPEKEKTDWTTYIIIGAAALAIIILLWPKRKK